MQAADGGDPSGPNGAPDDGTGRAEDSFDTLRELLIGKEQRALERIEEHLAADRLQARDVGSVLPEAVRLLTAEDDRLARALAPTIEDALQDSVRRNPGPLTDAIFPIIGPAIRKSIQAALAAAMDGFNRVLEQSLSPRSFKWRIQAWRTGKPFAEVVLLHSLSYRVEQLFLIHRPTSLLLRHIVASSAPNKDADLVSAMLSAIQDFVGDSFSGEDRGELHQIEVSGFSVEISQGPNAVLAAVVRGVAPAGYRTRLQGAVEAVHLEMAAELASFDGDDTPFAAIEPLLEERLEEKHRTKETKRRSPWVVLGPLLVVAGVLVALATTRSARGRRAWTAALEQLESEPGIVVITAERADGEYRIHGLRDEDSRDPQSILERVGIDPSRVQARWVPYHSLAPGLVFERARRGLEPPPSVHLRLEGTRLVASGAAPGEWIRRARAVAAGIPGVSTFDGSELEDQDLERFGHAVSALERAVVRFPRGSASLSANEASLREWLRLVDEVQAAAARSGRLVRIDLTGNFGPEETDRGTALARTRAEAVRDALLDHEATGSILAGVVETRTATGEAGAAPEVRSRVISLGRLLPLEGDG